MLSKKRDTWCGRPKGLAAICFPAGAVPHSAPVSLRNGGMGEIAHWNGTAHSPLDPQVTVPGALPIITAQCLHCAPCSPLQVFKWKQQQQSGGLWPCAECLSLLAEDHCRIRPKKGTGAQQPLLHTAMQPEALLHCGEAYCTSRWRFHSVLTLVMANQKSLAGSDQGRSVSSSVLLNPMFPGSHASRTGKHLSPTVVGSVPSSGTPGKQSQAPPGRLPLETEAPSLTLMLTRTSAESVTTAASPPPPLPVTGTATSPIPGHRVLVSGGQPLTDIAAQLLSKPSMPVPMLINNIL